LEVNPLTNEPLTSVRSEVFNNENIAVNDIVVSEFNNQAHQSSAEQLFGDFVIHHNQINEPITNDFVPSVIKHEDITIDHMFGIANNDTKTPAEQKPIDDYFIVNNTNISPDNTNNTLNHGVPNNHQHNFLIVDHFDSEDNSEEMIALKRRQKKQEELHAKVLQKMENELKTKNQNKQVAMEYLTKFYKYFV
jgi:hypothetical protein